MDEVLLAMRCYQMMEQYDVRRPFQLSILHTSDRNLPRYKTEKNISAFKRYFSPTVYPNHVVRSSCT